MLNTENNTVSVFQPRPQGLLGISQRSVALEKYPEGPGDKLKWSALFFKTNPSKHVLTGASQLQEYFAAKTYIFGVLIKKAF